LSDARLDLVHQGQEREPGSALAHVAQRALGLATITHEFDELVERLAHALRNGFAAHDRIDRLNDFEPARGMLALDTALLG
jgi:hypothetical protein